MTQEENGNCFEVSAHIVLKLDGCDDPDGVAQGLSYLEQLKGVDARLAHGMVEHPTLKIMHPHSWVEFSIDRVVSSGYSGNTVMCLDCANGNRVIMPQYHYYRLGNIENIHRYTPIQVLSMLVKHEHYGPWEIAQHGKLELNEGAENRG